jgi:ATP-dependent Clp protease ATP-binding subunit ClpB
MQFDKFTIKSQEAIQESQTTAERLGHQEIKPEHLLSSLIEQKDGVIIPVLQKMEVNLSALKVEAERLLENLPKVSGGGFGQVYASQQFKKILDQSFTLASNMQDEYVSQEHLFLALLSEKGAVTDLLQTSAATRESQIRILKRNTRHWKSMPET